MFSDEGVRKPADLDVLGIPYALLPGHHHEMLLPKASSAGDGHLSHGALLACPHLAGAPRVPLPDPQGYTLELMIACSAVGPRA